MLNAERGDCASVAKIIEQSQGEQKMRLKRNIFQMIPEETIKYVYLDIITYSLQNCWMLNVKLIALHISLIGLKWGHFVMSVD